MYNIYIEKKKKFEEEQVQKKLNAEKKEKQKRKAKLSELYDKYETRVKDFIMEMANVKPKIVVTNYSNPIENTRQMFLEENSNAIQGQKGFTFKGFKTEKERIAESVKNSHFLNSNFDVERKQVQQSANRNPPRINGKVGDRIIQPEMRFKPRTDLERIFDAINQNSFGREKKDVVNRQLQELDLNTTKKLVNEDESCYSLEKEDLPASGQKNLNVNMCCMPNIRQTEIPVLAKSDKVVNNKKNKIKSINSEAKNLMSDMHFKTHFKGASVMTLFPPSIANKSTKATDDKKQNKKSQDDNPYQQQLIHNPEIIIDREKGYGKNVNPLRSISNDHIDTEAMKALERIAFTIPEFQEDDREMISPLSERKRQKPRFFNSLRSSAKNRKRKKDAILQSNPEHFFKIALKGENFEDHNFAKKEEDKIVIGNESYNKINQMDLIAKKMLKVCNVYHLKNKNNNNILKSGNGKLMMTQGLTISEFEKKYKFS